MDLHEKRVNTGHEKDGQKALHSDWKWSRLESERSWSSLRKDPRETPNWNWNCFNDEEIETKMCPLFHRQTACLESIRFARPKKKWARKDRKHSKNSIWNYSHDTCCWCRCMRVSMYFMHFFLLSNLCPRRPTLQLSWLSLPHTHTGNNINNLSSRIFDRNSGYSEEQSSLSIKKMFIEKDKHRQKNWIEFSLQKSSLSTQVTLQLPWMPSWTLHRVQSETFINNNNKTNAIKKQDFRRKRKELSHEGVKNDSIQKRGSSLMIQTDKKTQKEIKSKLHPSSYLD